MRNSTIILVLLVFGCSFNPQKNRTDLIVAEVDSIPFSLFLQQDSCIFCSMDKIYPEIIGWAQDSLDIYAEGYKINGKNLKIYQPLKIDTMMML